MSTTSDGLEDPELHHRDERLAARDGLGVGLREQLERLFDVVGTRVADGRGDHRVALPRSSAPAARIDSTTDW